MIKKISLYILLILVTAGLESCDKRVKTEKVKPNIVYILVDDMGVGDCSINGQKLFTTPNIDQIALDGVRFTNHYSSSSVCAPTRCSLMTGKHQGNATIRGNFSSSSGERVSMSENDVTIAEILKEEGYTTGIIGKWGIGEEGTDHTPTKRGFDKWYGYINQKNAHNHYPEFLYHNTEKVMIPENENGKEGKYSHDIFTEQAKKFIKNTSNSKKPFFLYLAYTLPHSDLKVPLDDFNKWRDTFGDADKPYKSKIKGHEHIVEKPKATYAAMMTRLDRDIGEIMKLLKELGIDENTIVMFSSDNGPHDSDGNRPEFFNSNMGLRGIKRDLYEGGIRAPFFVKWTGKISAKSVVDYPSAQYDLQATICDLLGRDKPENTDGISFLPSMLGEEQKEKHEYLYWEFIFKNNVRQAVRFGDIKAVRYGLDNPIEIYDLSEDESEKNNIANTNPGFVKKAQTYFERAHVENPDFPFISKKEKE